MEATARPGQPLIPPICAGIAWAAGRDSCLESSSGGHTGCGCMGTDPCRQVEDTKHDPAAEPGPSKPRSRRSRVFVRHGFAAPDGLVAGRDTLIPLESGWKHARRREEELRCAALSDPASLQDVHATSEVRALMVAVQNAQVLIMPPGPHVDDAPGSQPLEPLSSRPRSTAMGHGSACEPDPAPTTTRATRDVVVPVGDHGRIAARL